MNRQILIVMIAFLSFWNREASAFFGSDSKDSSSGLNVTEGFDVNTITTISGTVVKPPERTGQEQHTIMTVSSAQGAVTVVLGPWWYWEKQAIVIAPNQTLAITGSLAQGKDGAFYVFAQQIDNKSSGQSITLRSETGVSRWSRAGSGNRSGAGSSSRTGFGNRGSGFRGGRR